MEDITLGQIAADYSIIAAIAEDARRLGLNPGRLLGLGGYGAVFEAAPGSGPCVLKIPWATPSNDAFQASTTHGYGPHRVDLDNPTGPFTLTAPRGLSDSAELLRSAVARQTLTGAGRPLARLLGAPILAGQPAALYERIEGHDFAWQLRYWPEQARARLGDIARALQVLHATFGVHGDLKPAHIFAERDAVVFIDPVGEGAWIGSIGYTLALPAIPGERGYIRDLAALAAIMAELWGGSLGWDAGLIYGLINRYNGRFGRGLDLPGAHRRIHEGTAPMPPRLREWAVAVAETALRYWEGTRPQDRWCQEMLESLSQLAGG